MSRSGFNQQRLGRIGLDAPGVTPTPPVSGSSNVANQIRGILSEAGRSVQIAGVIRAEDRAREDRENIGIAQIEADKQYAPLADSLIEDLRTRVRNGDDGALTDEGLAAAVESRVGSAVSKLGLNAAGEERFRLALTSRLTNNAFGLRREIQDEYRVEQVTNIAAGFSGVQSDQDFDEIASALREANPDLSESDINRLATPAMQGAAERGERALFEALAAKLPDGLAKKNARARLGQVERAADERLRRDAIEAGDEMVSSLMRNNDFDAAKAQIESSNLPDAWKDSRMLTVESREEKWFSEQREEMIVDLNNSLVAAIADGDSAAYAEKIESALDSGLFEPSDIPALNDRFGAFLTESLAKNVQTSLLAMRDATTPDERDAAWSRIESYIATAEHAVSLPSTQAGSISRDQYAAVTRIAEPAISQMLDQEAKHNYFERMLRDSETPTGATFDEIQLSSGKFGGKDVAADVATAKWESITAERDELLRSAASEMEEAEIRGAAVAKMSDWLARNSKAVLPEWEGQNIASIGWMFAAANPDNAERLPDARRAIREIAAAYQANPFVASRHFPEKMADMLDYIKVINEVLPLEDDGVLRMSLQALNRDMGQQTKYAFNEDDEAALDAVLEDAGITPKLENYPRIRAEAKHKAEILGTLLDNRMGVILKHVGESYKVEWAKSENFAFRTAAAGLGQDVDFALASRAIRGVHGKDDAVLRWDRATGRFSLYERDSLVAMSDVPTFTIADIEAISSARTRASSMIREQKAIRAAMDARSRRKSGRDQKYATLAERFLSLDPFGTLAAVPGVIGETLTRRYESAYMNGVHDRWVEEYVKSTTRSMNEYEKYVVGDLAPEKPEKREFIENTGDLGARRFQP